MREELRECEDHVISAHSNRTFSGQIIPAASYIGTYVCPNIMDLMQNS